MKSLIVLSILAFTFSCQAETAKKLPVHKFEKLAKEEVKAAKKEEDCDEKAKKPIEIKADTISLSGNTGCSLDEIKK